jgi:1-deoxy-D-xylulose-5-phosphate synthase
MRWVKPLDEDLLRSLATRHGCLITLEENAIAGGAGSGVAEWLAQSNIDCTVRHVGIPDAFIAHAGQGECRQLAGLTSTSIIAAAEGFAVDQISAPLSASQNQQAL